MEYLCVFIIFIGTLDRDMRAYRNIVSRKPAIVGHTCREILGVLPLVSIAGTTLMAKIVISPSRR